MEKKKLSLVFFIHFDGNQTYVLMGKQAPGKRLAGIRNGFGGKCEENESTLDCAIREVNEEVGLELKPNELVSTGKIVDEKMEVEVFVKISDTKFTPPSDNTEFVDVKWFDLSKPELFVPEMLPNNNVVIAELSQKVIEFRDTGKILTGFVVDETNVDSPELKLQKSKIHK